MANDLNTTPKIENNFTCKQWHLAHFVHDAQRYIHAITHLDAVVPPFNHLLDEESCVELAKRLTAIDFVLDGLSHLETGLGRCSTGHATCTCVCILRSTNLTYMCIHAILILTKK